MYLDPRTTVPAYFRGIISVVVDEIEVKRRA